MSFSEKVYRFLLRAYPRGYRERYADPMQQLFRDRLRDVRTFADLAGLWAGTLADWAVSAPARYWERVTPHTRFSSLADPGRRCIFFARFEASSFSRREITVEHLLLGILRQEPSLVPGVALEAVVRAIEANEPAGRRIPPMEDLRLSEETVRVVQPRGRSRARRGGETSRREIWRRESCAKRTRWRRVCCASTFPIDLESPGSVCRSCVDTRA